MASPSSVASSVVVRRLYKSLLRASKPFTPPSPNAAALTCLLHRTGIDDNIEDWKSCIQRGAASTSDSSRSSSASSSASRTEAEARDLSISYAATGPVKRSSSHLSAGDNNSNQQQQHQQKSQSYEMLFRRLLREVMGGSDGHKRMLFPSQVEPYRLRDIIRREFRDGGNDDNDTNNDAGDKQSTTDNMSSLFDDRTRRQVAFVALRELNKKLVQYESLQRSAPSSIFPNQAARHVSPLNFNDPSSYLRPGTFLVANPHLNDSIFTKSVICILEHKTANNNAGSSERYFKRNDEIGSTYGLIINKISVNQETGENHKLRDVFKKSIIPERIGETFVGESIVRDGGPVHVSLQMLYSVSSSTDTELAEQESSTTSSNNNTDDDDALTSSSSSIGGRLIPMIPDDDNTSTALYSDRATYFQGDLFKAIDAVEKGKIDPDEEISFFVGASHWSPGQLESEVAQGVWIPVRGPPEIALKGICEHEPLTEDEGGNLPQPTTASTGKPSISNTKRPLPDLWLSMLSACGEQETFLAHLFHHQNNDNTYSDGNEELHDDENGLPCDAFDI